MNEEEYLEWKEYFLNKMKERNINIDDWIPFTDIPLTSFTLNKRQKILHMEVLEELNNKLIRLRNELRGEGEII